jgi:uncharacterized protein
MRTIFFDADDRLRNGWKILAFLAAYSLVSYAVAAALGALLPKGGRLPSWLPAAWVLGLICLGVSALALRFEGRDLSSLGFRLDRRWLLEFGAGTLLGLLLLVSAALLVRGLGGFHWERNSAVGLGGLLAAAWMYLAVGFFEETLFRGFAFQRLVAGLGAWPSLALAGLVFALAHWGNPGMAGATRIWATLNIGLAAILLGLAWIRTGSLALPIGIHLGWNWTQGSLLGFGVSGNEAPGFLRVIFHGRPLWLTGGDFGLEASLPCALLCLALILALARWKGTAPATVED